MARQKKSKLARDGDRAARAAEMLKAVAHPVRLRIIALLCEADQQVNALASVIGVPQTIVSQQLRILRLNRLVEASRRDGRSFYELAEPHLRSLIACVDDCRSAQR